MYVVFSFGGLYYLFLLFLLHKTFYRTSRKMHQLYVILYLIKEESKYFFNSKNVTQMNIFSVFNNNKINSLRISRNYIPMINSIYRYILKSEQCNGKGTLCLPFLLYWNFLFIIIIILSHKRMILKKYIV